MPETYLSLGPDTVFCRHSPIHRDRPGLLLIHGLGDSGLAFSEIFEDPRFEASNVVVPDLLGYGRSSRSATNHYELDLHSSCLWNVIDHFGLEDITLVGHSMGGDLGTLLCWQEIALAPIQPPRPRGHRIKRFMNIEGNLTRHDLFISSDAHRAAGDGWFDEWFHWHFLYRRVYGEWCQRGPSGRRYLASLQFCDPLAFQQNASQLYERSEREGPASFGKKYRDLSAGPDGKPIIPSLFVFGQKSLAEESRDFAIRHRLNTFEIVGGHHWPMIEFPEEFYGVLLRFCRGEEAGSVLAETGRKRRANDNTVARVKVDTTVEYDDESVQETLDDSNSPWLIRQARSEQDRLLWDRFGGKAIRIADIGCGDARHGERYAPQCTLYHGYEISKPMVEAARRRCEGLKNVRIVNDDARKVVLLDKYDVAWCLYFTPGNLRDVHEELAKYDVTYFAESTCFIDIMRKFFAALEVSGSLFLTVYKDTPQAEEAQRSFYRRTNQFVLTDFGSGFVATDRGFWSRRWTREALLEQLGRAGVPQAAVTFVDLNEIAWLVEARKDALPAGLQP